MKLYFLLCCHVIIVLCSRPNIIVLFIENIDEVVEHVEEELMLPSSSNDLLNNLLELHKESIRFHNVYGEISSTSSFASLLTGKPAYDLGMIRGKLLPFTAFPSLASTGALDLNEITVAEVLKECNYYSWFTGYWKMGMGPTGDRYPMKHGFDTWMGVAYPHSDWCKHPSKHNHPYPYLRLFYRSFLWILFFFAITALVWFKFISFRFYVNLVIYTISASLAFYAVLHMFMVQRCSSCVLFYHDFVYQQPYDLENLTLHFTRHSSRLIELVGEEKNFFMVLNYLKMSQPDAHSKYFGHSKYRTPKQKALHELDWSVGHLMNKLKALKIYEETLIIVTGSHVCGRQKDTMKAYRRNSQTLYESFFGDLFWTRCFKTPLWIKNVGISNVVSIQDVYSTLSFTTLFGTILDSSQCPLKNSHTTTTLLNFAKIETCPIDQHQRSFVRNLTLDSTSVSSHIYTEMWNEHKFNDTVTKQKQFDNEFIFHYFDVYKPVMVTYKGRYHIVYYVLNKNDELEKLGSPLIFDMHEEPIDNRTLEDIYSNVTAKLKAHMTARQNVNPWSSQFEMPIHPWLMPCSNFPRCETTFVEGVDDLLY